MRLNLCALVACGCLALIFIVRPALAQNSYEVGRMLGYRGDPVYLAATIEDAKLTARLHKLHQELFGGSATPYKMKKFASLQEQIKPLVAQKRYMAVSPGVLAVRLSRVDLQNDDLPIIYKVVIVSGPQKGWVGFTPVFASTEPRMSDNCVVFDKYGAFDETTRERFLDAIDKGDDQLTDALISLEEVFEVAQGTSGHVEEVKEDLLQIRLTSGKYKGKLLWFEKGQCSVLDQGTSRNIDAFVRKAQFKYIKPLTSLPVDKTVEATTNATTKAQAPSAVETLPYKSIEVDGVEVRFYYSLSSIYLLHEQEGKGNQWMPTSTAIIAESEGMPARIDGFADSFSIKGKLYRVSYSSGDSSILDFTSISKPGLFTAFNPGTTTLSITVDEKSTTIPITVTGLPIKYKDDRDVLSDKLGKHSVRRVENGDQKWFFDKYSDATFLMGNGEEVEEVTSDGWHMLNAGKVSGKLKQR